MQQIYTELKEETDSSTVIVGNFNIPCSIVDKTNTQKVNKKIEDLNTINQLDLKYIYKTLHPTIAQCLFFSNVPETFSRIDHIVGHKTFNTF